MNKTKISKISFYVPIIFLGLALIVASIVAIIHSFDEVSAKKIIGPANQIFSYGGLLALFCFFILWIESVQKLIKSANDQIIARIHTKKIFLFNFMSVKFSFLPSGVVNASEMVPSSLSPLL